MKKVCYLACVMMCFLIVLPAAANPILIYEPTKEFEVRGKGTELDTFIAGGKNGWVSAFDSLPENEPIDFFPNGTEFLIDYYKCIKDDCWASVERVCFPWENEFHLYLDYFTDRYISAEDLVPAYDSEAFIEQHGDEIQPFEEDVDICSMMPFDLWKYPNSNLKLTVFDDSFLPFSVNCEDHQEIRERYHVDRVYTDETGDRWITFEDGLYRRGRGWVNIGLAAE